MSSAAGPAAGNSPTVGETSTSAAGGRPAFRAWRWLPIAVVLVIADQASKAWMLRHFTYGENWALLPVLNITLRYNTGAAFSVLADASGWQRWFFTALAIAVGVGIVVWLYRLNGRTQWLLAVSLSLILGGALGNLIDRLRLGHVIDFIEPHWKDARFPAFNLADSAITVGAVLMLLDAWFVGGRRRSS
ncbi:MAG TPA: signal peptidase II [Steroidobacteraceae bacterium]|nr:signal peptidase II [Steroidobacteraceae bacterium]